MPTFEVTITKYFSRQTLLRVEANNEDEIRELYYNGDQNFSKDIEEHQEELVFDNDTIEIYQTLNTEENEHA